MISHDFEWLRRIRLLRPSCGAILVTKIISADTEQSLDRREGRQTNGKTADQAKRWCPGAELNHRHTDFQSVALPTELPGRLARGAYRGDRACLSSRALPGWLANSNRLRVRDGKFFVDLVHVLF